MIRRHLTLAISANLISTGLVVFGQVLTGPYNYVAWFVAVAIWGFFWLAIEVFIRPRWSGVRDIWYYFLLTAPVFWYLEERWGRQAAEEKVEQLLTILPQARIVAALADPEQRTSALSEVYAEMLNMTDQRLAVILDEIRMCAPSICAQPDSNDYMLFRKIVDVIPSCPPGQFQVAWDYFLGLLKDIFDSESPQSCSRRVKRDLVTTLAEAVWRVNSAHLAALERVVEKVMSEITPEHDIARDVLKMMLDERCSRQVRQRIFNEAKKRAFKYPRDFGYDLLCTLRELKHRVFWLDSGSLREVVAARENYAGTGIISSNRPIYDELCRTVFSPLEESGHENVHHGRLYRRLKGKQGEVRTECSRQGSKPCTCVGQSLSLRGLYSGSCSMEPKKKIDIVTLSPANDPNRKFALRASVADLHRDHNGNPVGGRGLYFEDAEERVAKSLYDYITGSE